MDVTQTILSMGMTEGEPNGIVYLQRPLWAAFVQGSRDRRVLSPAETRQAANDSPEILGGIQPVKKNGASSGSGTIIRIFKSRSI